jgi:hypothetical protein
MTEDSWVFVERFGGQTRRVTVLDETLRVIAMHERPDAPPVGVPDECELLRAGSLERTD